MPIFFLLVAMNLGAQKITLIHKSYDWVQEPKVHTLTAIEEREGSVVLRDQRISEYAYDVNGDLVLYYTRHMIIRVNNDKSIEENNKVYIPLRDVIQFVSIKARSISKGGKVTEVAKENIKDIENFENYGPFRIFAFEGVEVGSEVEYLYTTMRSPSLYGSESFQSEELKKHVELNFLSPENIRLKAKCYNCTEEIKTGLDDAGRNFINYRSDYIPGLKEERYAAYRANLQRVEFKIAFNMAMSSGELYTFNNAADNIYADIVNLSAGATSNSEIKSFSKKGKKVVSKFLDTLKIPKNASLEERIRCVESGIKNYIHVKEDASTQPLDKLFQNRFATPKNLTRLFVEIFSQMKIENEVVLTTDRFNLKFDKELETWNYLDHYLVYFPGIDLYLAPGMDFSRLGVVPNEWICNDALFIKGVKKGDKTTGSARTGTIRCPEHTMSYDNIYADITFDEELSETRLKLKRTLSGYSAGGLQVVFAYIQDDVKKQETIDQLLKITGEDTKLKNIKIQNLDEKSSGRKELILEADLSTGALLEKAGTKYIFKIGDVIGPQAELYQEDKRKQPVENEYNRGYHRELSFTIPDGYKVSNLEALNMSVTCKNGDKISAEFVSTYVIAGNKIKVTIEENYRDIRLPVEQFEPFRKVINAAADFNKITLFLEKK